MSRYVPFSIGERVIIDDIDCMFDGCVTASAGPAADDDLVFVDRRTGSRHRLAQRHRRVRARVGESHDRTGGLDIAVRAGGLEGKSVAPAWKGTNT